MVPENIRWSSAYQALPNQVGWPASGDGSMQSMGRRSGRVHENGYYASPNGISLFDSNHINVPNTGSLVKKVCWSRFFVEINEKLSSQFRVLLTGGEGIIPSRCVCNSKGKETAYSKLVYFAQ